MPGGLPFALGEKIGAGSMAEVFAAELDGRPVAVKILAVQLPEPGLAPVLRSRLVREIAILSRLDHPRIIPILASDCEDPRPWYAMPLIPGALRDLMTVRLDSGTPHLRSVAAPRAQRILAQVVDALAAIHAQGVIHRDVRPANIRVTPSGDNVLCDFGLAIGAGDERGIERKGLGVPGFSAPELLADPASATARSDVYSAAAIAYAMHTARLAEPGCKLPATLPSKLREVLERALCVDPAGRWADAGRFGAALTAARAGN